MTEDGYIKREAALEAIDRIRLEVWLIDIPSPTVPEYIEHHEGIQHVLGEIDALRKKVEQLPGIDEQNTGKWIPCKERLPERSVEVLTYTENVGLVEIQSREIQFGVDVWENQHGDLQEFRTVTAWMPLPEPYEEGER